MSIGDCSKWESVSLSIHVTCDATNQALDINPWYGKSLFFEAMGTPLINGDLKVYWDGEEVQLNGGVSAVANWRGTAGLKPHGSDSHELKVSFFPVQNCSTPASVSLTRIAFNMPRDHNVCLDHKECLAIFSDSAAWAHLRNRQDLQLKCLHGHTLDTETAGVCEQWLTCLSAKTQTHLRNMLEAFWPAAVLTETRDGSAEHAPDPAGCLDPTLSDPESWECDCYGRWSASCEALGQDFGDCMLSGACASDRVCPSWKKARSCPDPAALSFFTGAEKRAAEESGSSPVTTGKTLDDSFQAKACI